MELTKVIFRKFADDGDVIAVFPEIPNDRFGSQCLSYMHVGQHSGCDPFIADFTVPATQNEHAGLKRELENIGYMLDVRKRVSRRMHCARRVRAWS